MADAVVVDVVNVVDYIVVALYMADIGSIY